LLGLWRTEILREIQTKKNPASPKLASMFRRFYHKIIIVYRLRRLSKLKTSWFKKNSASSRILFCPTSAA
jgi:hypothetical protein